MKDVKKDPKLDAIKEMAKGNPKKLEKVLEHKRGKENKKRFSKGVVKQDPSWTNKFPTLKRYVGTVATNFIAGMALDQDLSLNLAGTVKDVYPTKVMAIPFVPVPGYSDSMDSPINIVSRATWLAMHRLYRGLGSYQQSDLGITLWAIIDLFTEIAEAERAYGIACHYNILNRTIPLTLSQALNINLASIEADLANFRIQLNLAIQKAKCLCLPKDIAILERYVTMVTRVFKDSESNRASTIVFRKMGYWTYEDAIVDTGTAAQFTYHTPARTATNILSDINTMLGKLLNDDDVTRICSDILAAYAKNNPESSDIMTLSTIDEGYTVVPEYNRDWLREIHNLETVGSNFNSPACDIDTRGIGYVSRAYTADTITYQGGATLVIQQHNNVIQFEPYGVVRYAGRVAGQVDSNDPDQYAMGNLQNAIQVSGQDILDIFTSGNMNSNHLYDTEFEEIDVDTFMDISSFKFIANPFSSDVSGTAYYSTQIVSCRSELVPCFEVYDNVNRTYFPYVTLPVSFNGDEYFWRGVFTSYGPLDFGDNISKIDWHPIIVGTAYAGGSFRGLDGVVGDLDNPVVKPLSMIEVTHHVALLSLLTNPLCYNVLSEDK